MQYTQQTKSFWNSFDRIALYINMWRRLNESNKYLGSRYLLTVNYPGSASRQGMANSIITTFYGIPDIITISPHVSLTHRPLSPDDAQRHGVAVVFIVTNNYTGENITNYINPYDDVFSDKKTQFVYFYDSLNTEVKVRYNYYDEETDQVITLEELFDVSTVPLEQNIHLYNLYNDEEAIAAGVIDMNNNLTKLGRTIAAELKSAIKTKWGVFKWNWDPWDAVAIFNRENILITPKFDVTMGAFDEYRKLS